MKKEMIILLVILMLVIVPGCFFNKKKDSLSGNLQKDQAEYEEKENVETPQLDESSSANPSFNPPENVQSTLDDFQSTACISAQKADKCEKLANLSIVTEEDCCKNLGKCCKDE